MFYKYEISKTTEAGYKYVVKEGVSIDGETFIFVGTTAYFDSKKAAEAYQAEMKAKHEPPKKPAALILNGKYYVMTCMNAFIDGRPFPVEQFQDENEAIQTAADYEATLYLLEYQDGRQINSTVIYDPRENQT